MIKFFLFFSALLSFNLSVCQDREAKIILMDNKTVEGFGEIKKNKIYFKLTLDEKPEIWTEADAKGLEFTGYRSPEKYLYVFHGKKNEAHLMEVIQEGSVELYKDTYYIAEYSGGMMAGSNVPVSTVNSVKHIEYYIKKPNDTKGTLVTMNFKKIGKNFFSDCEDLMSQINEEEYFEEEEMIDLVKYYNHNCKE